MVAPRLTMNSIFLPINDAKEVGLSFGRLCEPSEFPS
jgi:hypothetical protein